VINVFKKIVIWLIAVVCAVFIALFSLANRTPVELELWPLPFSQSVPVFAVMLACVAIGIFWGGFAAWLSAGKARKRAREATRRAEATEADLRHAEDRSARLENDLRDLRAQTKNELSSTRAAANAPQLTAPSKSVDAA